MMSGFLSADSHVVEPPNCYVDHIDPRYRADAPHLVRTDKGGDVFVIPGMQRGVPMGLMAAAGVASDDLLDRAIGAVKFEDLHRSGWDPSCRKADQERDGVIGEILYASVGMMINSHPDVDYRQACFEAYNRWLAGYCAEAPERLFGLAQTAIRSVDDGIDDFRRAKEAGFRGMMMPGIPHLEDYDHPMYDALWECAVDLGLPLSFHILTSGRASDAAIASARGHKANSFMNIIRSVQDVVGVFVLGGVFERHPGLKMVCAEADAGWMPHYMYRLDHAYDRHGYGGEKTLSRAPSAYVWDNVWLTFQDDWSAFRAKEMLNTRRLLWANDFPHSDSTWPNSQKMLAEHTQSLADDEALRILRDNAAELYGISV